MDSDGEDRPIEIKDLIDKMINQLDHIFYKNVQLNHS